MVKARQRDGMILWSWRMRNAALKKLPQGSFGLLLSGWISPHPSFHGYPESSLSTGDCDYTDVGVITLKNGKPRENHI
jgi:hypothetical protein